MRLSFFKKVFFLIPFLFLVPQLKIAAQDCDTCDNTLTFYVDLSSNPDTLWMLEDIERDGLCCMDPDTTSTNTRCVRFIVYLNSETDMIDLKDTAGASPGSKWVFINCEYIGSLDDPICVAGDTLCIVYCKQGGNKNSFTINAIDEIEASPDIAVSQGCVSEIWCTGLDSLSVQWHSIAPGIYDQYLGYLTDPLNDTTLVTPGNDPNPPDSVVYVVSGVASSYCAGAFPISDTVIVYFYDSSGVDIQPDPAFICKDGLPQLLTAYPYGGAPPYTYIWNDDPTLTTQSISVSSEGWYWVEVQDTSDCPPKYDTVWVEELESDITCFAGNDTTICANSPIVNLNGTIQIASGGVWSSDGVGVFGDTASLSTTYDASNDIAAGDTSIWIYLTTTGNGDCPPGEDSLLVTVVQTPTISIYPDGPLPYCANNPAAILYDTLINGIQALWTTSNPGDPGTFSPNDSVTNGFVVYYPSPSDTANGGVWIYCQSIGACGYIKDSVYIEYTPAPWVNAGEDVEICNTQSSIQLNGLYSGDGNAIWSGGSGAAQFSSITDPNATYTFSPADITNGIVTLIYTSQNNGNCNPVSDSIVITLNAPPVITITVDSTVCVGDTVFLEGTITGDYGNTFWSSTGSGSIDDMLSLNTFYIPGVSDTVSITFIFTATGITPPASGGCNPASENITVTILPPPIVNPGNDTTVCENNTNITLYGSLTYATTGVWSTNGTGSFSPSDTIVSGVNYIPSEDDILADSVILTLTSTDGCSSVSDSMIVYFSPAPIVNAGNDTVLCYGVMTTQLNASFTGLFTRYYWYRNIASGTISDSTILNPLYTLSQADTANGFAELIFAVELAGCNPVTDTVRIYVGDTASNVYINPDAVTICSNEFVTINDFNVTSTTNSGIWQTNGDGYFLPNDTATSPPVYYYPGTSDTTNGTVTLYFQSTYSCDYDYDSLIVTITSGPWVNAGPDDTICAGNTYTLNGSSSTGTGEWITGTGTFNLDEFDLDAVYTPSLAEVTAGFVDLVLMSTNNGGCSAAYDTVRIIIIPAPTVTASGPDSVCRNGGIILDGELTSGIAEISWSTNGTSGYFSPSDTVLDPTYYPTTTYTEDSLIFTIHAQSYAGCPGDSAQIVVHFKPTPVLDAGPDDSVCRNNLVVDLLGTCNFYDSVLWENNGFNGSFTSENTLATSYNASTLDTALAGVWVTLTAYFSGCDPLTDSLWITFTDPAYVYAGSDLYVCENAIAVSVSGIISGTSTTGYWTTLGDGSFDDSTSLSTLYVFGGADTSIITLILQSTNNGDCDPVYDTLLVFLTDSAAVNAGPDDTVCANNPLVYLNGQITGSPGTGVWTILQGGGAFIPYDTALNAYYNPDTTFSTHTLVLYSTNACSNSSDTMNVTITPSPVVYAGPDIVVCQGESSVALNGTITGGASTGYWTTNGAGTFDDTASLSTNYNLVYPADSSAGSVEIYLTALDTGNCFSVTDTLVITFGDQPIADFSYTSPNCQYDTVYFTNNSSLVSSNDSIVAWEWNFGNGITDTAYNGSCIYTTTGNFTVVLTITTARGCIVTDTAIVAINPTPNVNFSFDPPYCNNAEIQFENTTSDIININNWTWILGNGDTSYLFEPPPVLYDTVGTYTVTLIAVNDSSCSADTSQTFYINPSPIADFYAQNVCIGEPTSFFDISTPPDSIAWKWYFGDGDSSDLQNPTHTFATTDTFDVSLIFENIAGCTDTMTQPYFVWPDPVINVSGDTLCPLDSIIFSTNMPDSCTFIWNFGDGSDTSMQANPVHVYNNTTGGNLNYTVQVIVTNPNGCIDTATVDIVVRPNPVVDFTFAPTTSCPGDTTQFQNTSPDVSSFMWDFGDGTLDSLNLNPYHIFWNDTSIAVIYPVTLTITDSYGCSNDTTKNDTIEGIPLFTSIIAPDTVCPDEQFTMTGDPLIYTYEWDMGNGTIIPGNPANYQYPDQGLIIDTTFIISVIAETSIGCRDTILDSIVMNPIPLVNAGPDDTVCANNSLATLSGQVSGYPGTGIWSIYTGDGTFSPGNTNLNANYSPDTTYNVHQLILQATNACEDITDTMNVIITPSPIVDAGEDIVICQGESIVALSGTITGGASAGVWTTNGSGTFDDSTSLNTNYNVSYPADSLSAYIEIYLTSTDTGDCFAVTDTIRVSFGDQPTADFTYAPIPACQLDTIYFTDVSTIVSASDSIAYWYWDFGNGSTDSVQNPFTIYDTSGIFNVELTVVTARGCTDTYSTTLQISPAPVAYFTYTAPYCDNANIVFTDSSFNVPPSITNWNWDFGNGNTSTLQNPPEQPYTSSGDYTVYFEVMNSAGCSDDTTRTFYICESPVADFTVAQVCINEPTAFVNETQPIDSIALWKWYFGDGDSSDLPTPTHVFTDTSTHYVTLIAESFAGCTDTITYPYYVWPEPEIITAGDTVCPLDSITFATNLPDSCTFIWDFGDGTDTSMSPNPVHVFNNFSGNDIVYTVELIAINPNGCDDTTTVNVIVHPYPFVSFIPSPSAACPNTPVHFQRLSPPIVQSFLWDFGDGDLDSLNDHPDHIFTNDTNVNAIFPVSLLVTDTLGCQNSRTINYTVYGLPLFSTILEPDSVCPLEQFDMGAYPKMYDYEWQLGDGTIKNGDSVNHQYESLQLPGDTTFLITIIASNSNNCTDTAYRNVVMHPFPFPDFALDTLAGCSPVEIFFTNTSSEPPLIDSIYYGIDTTNDLISDIILPYPTNSYPFTNSDSVQKTYNVILNAFTEYGCRKKKSRSVTIYPEITPEFIITPIDSGCSPLDVVMQNLTLNADEFTWHLGDELNTNTNPNHTFTNSSTTMDSIYNVWLEAISEFGCYGVSDTQQVTVFKTPVANFAIFPTAGCTPLETEFENNSYGHISSYWDFGNGDTSTLNDPGVIVYENTNSNQSIAFFPVELIVENLEGCTDTVQGTVKVYPAIEAEIFTDTTAGCHPLTVQFSTTYVDSVEYHWEFGDGNTSNQQNISHEYINNADSIRHRQVLLTTTSTNSCQDTASIEITIYPTPEASFGVTPTQGCTPLDIQLSDFTVNADSLYFIFNGDSTASQTFITNYQLLNDSDITQIQDIELWVQSEYGCWDYRSNSVEIHPKPSGEFEIANLLGCPPLQVSFINNSDTTAGNTFSWNFGDGLTSTQQNPMSHIYSNASNYDLSLFYPYLLIESINGCISDTILSSDSIVVYPKPNADFAILPDSVIIFTPPFEDVHFENLSSCGNCIYEWNFGDGNTSSEESPTWSYSLHGDYEVVLKATADPYGCIDSTRGIVHLELIDPVAQIVALSPVEGCVPLTVTLVDSSQGNIPGYNIWDLNQENQIKGFEEITFKIGAANETYKVTLSVKNSEDGEYEYDEIIIRAHLTPVADFELASNVLDIPEDKLVCINTCIGADYYLWDFGDGETSVEYSPAHEYDAEGSYDVSLIAYTEYNCSDTIIKYNAVAAESKCKIIMPNAFTPDPNGPNGGRYNPEVPNITNDIFHPVYNDIKKFKMEIFNRWGEVVFVSNDINVGWDGYYLGKPVEQDVYVWKVTADCYSGNTISKMGSVTVLW